MQYKHEVACAQPTDRYVKHAVTVAELPIAIFSDGTIEGAPRPVDSKQGLSAKTPPGPTGVGVFLNLKIQENMRRL